MIYGRDRERARLRELLDDAIAGHGSLVLVSGEAGIGKTTLVDDLIHESQQRSCLVLTGGCYDLTTTPPYGPWLEVIGSYDSPEGGAPFPSWFADPEAIEQMGSQAQLFEEARRFFADVARRQPLVIVLEDLHWSDTASLDALRFLSRRLEGIPLLLIATYRDDEITRRHQLFQLLPALARESGAARFHVNRLAEDDVRELVAGEYPLNAEDLDRLTAHIARLAEGNPFYVVELLHTLDDDGIIRSENGVATVGPLDAVTVPPLIQQVIERRLRSFDDEQRKHLEAAAVIGHNIPLDIWLAVTGLDTAKLADLATIAISTRVIEQTPDGNGFRFIHALTRESLYEGHILIHRRELHRRTGEALVDLAPQNASQIAHHFLEAADERAYDWLLLAAEQAERSWAWGVAAELVEQAVGLLIESHPRRSDRGWLLYRIGLRRMWNDPRRSMVHLEASIEEAQCATDEQLAVYALSLRGAVWCAQGEFRRGILDFERSTTEPTVFLTSPPKVAGFAPSVVGDQTLIIWLATVGRFPEASERYDDLVDRDGESITLRAAQLGYAKALAGLGRIDESYRYFQESANAAQIEGDLVNYGSALGNELVWLNIPYATDDVARRHELLRASSDWYDNSRLLMYKPLKQAHLIPSMHIDGHWNVEAIRTSLRDMGASGSWGRDNYRAILATIVSHQGEIGMAQQAVSEILPNGSATDPGDSFFIGALMAQRVMLDIALDSGQMDAALEWLRSYDRWINWSGGLLGLAEGQLGWARYHRVAGNLRESRQHAVRAYKQASDPRQPLALIAADRFLGHLEVDEGKWDEAERRLTASLELAERCEAPFEQALTLVVMAERAAKLGEVDEARTLIRRVREICEPLKASPTLERIDEIEAMLPKVRRGNGEHPFGLTDREVEVLRLVARGRTDAEAAEELFISPRTVSQHLRNIYNKLGVNNRAEATRVAVEQGMV